jgi:beta-ribofuranosylaminobenzene 5'-phosphate synthase
MIRVETPSRLHFGLLSLAAERTSPASPESHASGPLRRFGGVGLMVDRPGIKLHAKRATHWSATGPLAERALAFARNFETSVQADTTCGKPCKLTIEHASPEHAGLGAGTQLGLAVATCLSTLWGLQAPVTMLARYVKRGERSALGVHGFEHGGFLVEGGQSRAGAISPLVVHSRFPPRWRVLLARPHGERGVHGREERTVMAGLTARPQWTEALCRLVLLGMLPALAENDVDAFGEALFEFNVLAGEPFAHLQGGAYASPFIKELVAFLRGRGVRGTGQSSWGPTVFAVLGDTETAETMATLVRQEYANRCDVLVTRVADRGARVEVEADPCE